MKLVLDPAIEEILLKHRSLVLVERGGLQYYQTFSSVWPGPVCTLAFSRYLTKPPVWHWGGPSQGMAIFDKSTTTGLTLLKLKLFFKEYDPLILGSFSLQNGRAGLEVADFQCEIRGDHEVQIGRLPNKLGGTYMFACDTPKCAELVSEIISCPIITLPRFEELESLPTQANPDGPLVLSLMGENMDRGYLVGRILNRVLVGVSLNDQRTTDIIFSPSIQDPELTARFSVRMGGQQLLRMYGNPDG